MIFWSCHGFHAASGHQHWGGRHVANSLPLLRRKPQETKGWNTGRKTGPDWTQTLGFSHFKPWDFQILRNNGRSKLVKPILELFNGCLLFMPSGWQDSLFMPHTIRKTQEIWLDIGYWILLCPSVPSRFDHGICCRQLKITHILNATKAAGSRDHWHCEFNWAFELAK
jgi:hypothetical protein